MKVEVDVPGYLSRIVPPFSVDIKATLKCEDRTREMCESRGGWPGLPVPNGPYGLCGHRAGKTELGSCVKEEVGALGSWSLIVPTVSVDVRQH